MNLESVRRLLRLAAIGLLLPTLACFEEDEDIAVALDPCGEAELADLDAEVQAVFALLDDDGSDVHDQVDAACDEVMGDDYLVEECTSNGPFHEECVVVIDPEPAPTPEEQAIQDACVGLHEGALDLECAFGD